MVSLKHADRDAPLERHRHSLVTAMAITLVAAIYVNSEPELLGAFFGKMLPGKADVSNAVGSNELTLLTSAPAGNVAHATEGDNGAKRNQENETLLAENLARLERGLDRLSRVTGYTAKFFKQERIDGELCEEQVVDLKLRHRPFSVYMKWEQGEVGQELLFVEGENDGKMVVHPGGLRGRILRSIKVYPESDLSLAENRYPVTRAGMLSMMREAVARRRADLGSLHDVRCEKIADQEIGGRPCDCYVLTWGYPGESPKYRKSVHCIDKELSLLVCIKNYGWPEEGDDFPPDQLDEETLVEHYMYTDLQLDTQLTARDFDDANDQYDFRR